MADIKLFTAEVEAAVARYKAAPSWEAHDVLQAEVKAIVERHGLPLQHWGKDIDLKKRAAELSQKSPEELMKIAAEVAKRKP